MAADGMDVQDEREDRDMERRKNPSEEKARAYRDEHHYWYAHAHRERRDRAQKKALRNQTYRQQVKRNVARALAAANDLDEVSPDRVRRVKSRRLSGAVKLDAWVQWKLTQRRMRAAASFF